jgi:hypothetical protein
MHVRPAEVRAAGCRPVRQGTRAEKAHRHAVVWGSRDVDVAKGKRCRLAP